jgi:tripartite ATP-independent transporter DctP family solute receptor
LAIWTPARPVAAGAKIVLRAGHSATVTEPFHIALETFKRRLEELTGGQVEVRLYPNRRLGNDREMLAGLSRGTGELAVAASAVLAEQVPELKLFDLPFVFRDRPHLHRVLDGPMGQELAEMIRAKGFRLLAFYEAGVRHLMTRGKPISRLEDLAGLKIRTLGNPMHQEAFRVMGASPIPLAYGEVYGALDRGAIDGADAASTGYESQKFYEVAPHWSVLAWTTLVSGLVMGEQFFAGLPAAVQGAIRLAAQESAQIEREATARAETAALDALKARGVMITAPDREPFRRASRAIYRTFGGPEDRVRLEKILDSR